jgi:iron-sulfur cluster insertion protein
MSAMYMEDAVIDYQETLMNSQFVIQNPNAQTQCGCGSSFSIG